MTKRTKTIERRRKSTIHVAHEDRVRLEGLLRGSAVNPDEARNRAALAGELARARVMPQSRIPPFVVRMDSTVRLRDLETGEEGTYTLVFPEEADIDAGKVSVLAPVGTALLGYEAEDVIEWPVPAGVRRFRIEEVFPPVPAVLRVSP